MATEKYSILNYPGDGARTVWPITFAGGYISRSHVKAYVTRDGAWQRDITLFWIGDYTVRALPVVATGDVLTIYRDTPKDLPVVTFNDDGILSDTTLNTNAKQAVFIAAEMVDKWGPSDGFSSSVASINARIDELSSVGDGYADRLVDLEAGVALFQDWGVDVGPTFTDVYAQITDEQTVRATADSAEATQRIALTARVTTTETNLAGLTTEVTATNAAITSEATARATADTAEAAARTTLAARVTTTETGIAGLTSSVSAVSANLSTEATTRATADTAEATARTTLAARVSTTETSISGLTTTTSGLATAISNEATTRATADSAEATARTALDSRVTTAEGTLATQGTRLTSAEAAITNESTTRATADTALSTSLSTLSAVVATQGTEITTNTANLSTESTARATADAAIVSTVTSLTSTVATNTAAITSEASTRASADTAISSTVTGLAATVASNTAAITSEASTRATADSALSSTLSSVSATVAGHTSSIATNTSAIAGNSSDIGTIRAQWSVTVDVDGRVSGIYQNSTATSADFVVVADHFAIKGIGGTPFVPFIVDTINNKIKMTNVEVDTLKINTAVVPLRAHSAPNTTGTGASNWSTVISGTVIMPSAGVIEADFSALQSFTGGSGNWGFRLYIDGNLIFPANGLLPGDAVSIGDSAQVTGPGTYTINVDWAADSSVTLKNLSLRAKGFPNTN